MKSVCALLFIAVTFIPSTVLAQPFDIKGDALNMTLKDFREKYHRPASGSDIAPFCSDRSRKGAYIALQVEGIGVIRCMQHYPYEEKTDSLTRRRVSPTTIGGTSARLVYSFIADDPVKTDDSDYFLHQLSATFASRSFSSVRDGLIEKFGAPSMKETKTLQNRMGATFDGHVLTWMREGYVMRLHEYFVDVDTANLVLMEEKRTKEYIQRLKAKRATDSAKDL